MELPAEWESLDPECCWNSPVTPTSRVEIGYGESAGFQDCGHCCPTVRNMENTMKSGKFACLFSDEWVKPELKSHLL